MIAVLFVDDEPVLLDIGRIYLERTGSFTVTVADSGRAALNAMKTGIFDVIVSDYEMPGMNGISLLKEIRESGDDIPFILFTGRGREEVAGEALNQGAAFYILKGGDPRAQFAELEHKILTAVDHHRGITALRESEQRLADIINFLPDATFAIDRSGTIIAWNRELERMTKKTAGEMVGRGNHAYAIPFYGKSRKMLVDLVFSPDPSVEARYLEFSRDANLVVADSIISDLTDSPRYFRSRASIFYDSGGRPAGAIESLRDITDQKMNELRLRESEEKLRVVTDYTPDWEIWEDPLNGIIYISPSCERITGYSPAEFIGNPSLIDEIIHPDDREKWTMHREVTLHRQLGEELDVRIRTKSGEVRWINHACGPVFSTNGQYIGHIASNHDITDRIYGENAIRESQARIHQVIQYLPFPLLFFHVDTNDVVLFTGANPAAGMILGKAIPFLIGREIGDIVPGNDVHMLAQACRDGATQEENRHVDAFRINPDENSTVYAVDIVPCGKKMVAAVFHEISTMTSGMEAGSSYPRASGNSAISYLSCEKCRVLIDQTRELIAVTRDRNIVYANRRFSEAVLGTGENARGHILTGFFVPEDRYFLEDEVFSGSPAEWSSQNPVRMTGSSGLFWVNLHATKISWEEEEAVLFFFSDVTSQVTAHLSLLESEQNLSGIIDFLPDPTLVIDTTGRILFWNRAIEEMTGVKSEEVLGKGDFQHGLAFYGEKRPMLIDLIQRPDEDIASRYSIHVRDADLLVADTRVKFHGEDRVLWGKAVLLRNSSGEVTGAIETIRDITERIRTQEALREANKKLSLLSQITRHDIRNKLTGLFGYLDLAEDNMTDPEITPLLLRIREIAVFILRQIEMTGEYQSIGAGDPVWHPVRDAFIGAAGSIPAEGISFSYTGDYYEILADPLIDKVFYNLLENAIRHAHGLSRISCSCREEERNLLIHVEDDGPGITNAMKEKIFERGVGSGTGMGLFLVREILSITGIMIQETGQEGTGARFEIRVPPGIWRQSLDTGQVRG